MLSSKILRTISARSGMKMKEVRSSDNPNHPGHPLNFFAMCSRKSISGSFSVTILKKPFGKRKGLPSRTFSASRSSKPNWGALRRRRWRPEVSANEVTQPKRCERHPLSSAFPSDAGDPAPHRERLSPRIPKGGQMMVGHPHNPPLPTNLAQTLRPMKNDQILSQISEYCRQADMAESTFGRRAVNDGKLVHRLREGKRITIDTLDRIQAYIAASMPGGMPPPRGLEVPPEKRDPRGNFRFFENRQKYLLFVHTCSEKRVIAERVALELGSIHPRPPALRVFDAGVGDGTVLVRVMRRMHGRFPHMPFYIAGKELSLEDVRLTLDKVPDRLFEHPATVFVLTNMYYAEAPWLTPASPAGAAGTIWHEVALRGASSGEFEAQIAELGPFLEQNWRANVSPRSGMPVYERPVAIVLYREDHRFLLDSIIPRAGRYEANFVLIIASQPYRAKSSVNFRAKRIIAPLARALRAGGRLIGIHSHGQDPGIEIIQAVWPGENPFSVSRHELLRAVKYELGSAGRDLNFNAYADNRSIFRYDMEALPNEVTGSIGTSTAFAAWNAAVYVAQIEDDRLAEMTQSGRTLDATREVLRKHNGLWFYDESYVISRRRD